MTTPSRSSSRWPGRSSELRAITTVAGNAPLDRTTRNALRVLTLLGRTDVPVAAGADRPLVREPWVPVEFHGDSGLDGADLPEPAVGHRPFLTEPEQLDRGSPTSRSSARRSTSAPPTDPAPASARGRSAPRPTSRARYHLDLGIEIFDWLEVVDFGDAYCPHGQTEVLARQHPRARRTTSRRAASCPSILGGDHSITWPAATAVADVHGYGNVGIVHFDAHADTADIIEGNLASHGTPMRRLIESGAVPGTPLRAGRPARLLAAAGHLRVDARAGHDVAPHAGDLGARLQGRHARRRRRGAGQGRQAVRLRRHRRPRPGARPRHRARPSRAA